MLSTTIANQQGPFKYIMEMQKCLSPEVLSLMQLRLLKETAANGVKAAITASKDNSPSLQIMQGLAHLQHRAVTDNTGSTHTN